jgi:hypothetical protein
MTDRPTAFCVDEMHMDRRMARLRAPFVIIEPEWRTQVYVDVPAFAVIRDYIADWLRPKEFVVDVKRARIITKSVPHETVTNEVIRHL